MRIQAPAKINWTLAVTGVREDGYHTLDTLMQQIALCDVVTLETADALTFRVAGAARVPPGESNLALRAARLIQKEAGESRGARITLEKRIPVGAGLGGGSADAAAVMRGLCALWGLDISQGRLRALGLTLGADVPYCLTGGLCRARGIGEELTPLACAHAVWLVVIQPCKGLSTREVFGQFERSLARPDTEKAADALALGDLRALAGALGNDLQQTATRLRPPISQAIAALRDRGARAAQMTGSGSAVFGVFHSADAARSAEEALKTRFPFCAMTHTL